MRHAEKIAPVAAVLTGLGTLVCCLPLGLATAAATASLSSVAAEYQPWFLGASLLLLAVGLIQLRRANRTCATRPWSSAIVFGVCAAIVLAIVLFPQAVAGLLADWLP